MFIDKWYIILVVPALLLGLYAQSRVNSTFRRYARVQNVRGLTGAQAARQILDSYGLQQVRVEAVAGELTDHYDPRAGAVFLSQSVYGSASVAAVGVAAHETGHAIQHAEHYAPLQVRSAIIPVTQLGSTLSPVLICLGLLFSWAPLVQAGILLFALVAVFQLVTLPVEYNASHRALAILDGCGMLTGDELDGAGRVLNAAALTYVAALVTTLAQLLRLILLFGNRRND